MRLFVLSALCCGFLLIPRGWAQDSLTKALLAPVELADEVVETPLELIVVGESAWILNEDNEPVERVFPGDVVRGIEKQDDRYLLQAGRQVLASDVLDMQSALSQLTGKGRRRRTDAASLSNRALVLLRQGNSEEGLKLINSVLETHEDHVPAWLTRSLIHLELGKFEQALSDARQGLSLSPENLQAALLVARGHRGLEQHQETLEFLGSLPEDLQAEPELVLERGYTHWLTKNYEAALRDVEAVLGERPEFVQAWYNRGLVAGMTNDDAGAIEAFTRALELNPQYTNAWYFRASSHERLGHIEEAVADYTRLLELKDSDIDALLARGRLLRQLGKSAKADEDFARVTHADNASHGARAEASFLRALCAEDAGDLEQALAHLALSIELRGDVSGPYRERARIYSRMDRMQEAEQDLRTGLSKDDTDSLAWRYLGDVLRMGNRPQEALEAYNRVVALAPRDSVAINNRGIVHEMLQQPEQALADYEQAVKMFPGNVTFRGNASLMHRKLGNFEAADRHLVEALEIHQDASPQIRAELLEQRGETARLAGNFPLALQCFNEVLEIDSQNAGVFNTRGICQHHLGKYREAIQDYSRSLELSADRPIVHINRGDSWVKLGEFQNAVQDYDKAVELDPQISLAYNQRGILHLERGDYSSAVRDFRKALEVNADDRVARGNLAVALRLNEEYAEALDVYARVVELDPENPATLWGRGECYRNLGRTEEAEADYRASLKLDRNYTLAWIGLGDLFESQDEFEEALEYYEEALKLEPQDKWALYRKGFCLTMLDEYEEAIPVYTQVLQLNPKHLNAWLFRGNAYRDTLQYAEAHADYLRALELDPDYEYIYIGRGLCLEMEKRYQEAVADYDRVLELAPDDLGVRNSRALLQASVRAKSVFNPVQALADARLICNRTNNENPTYLGTLAAAQAASGRYQEAYRTQQKVLQLAEKSGTFSPGWLESAREQLNLYRRSRPFILSETTVSPKAQVIPPVSEPDPPAKGGGLQRGARKLLGAPPTPSAPPAPESDIPAPPSSNSKPGTREEKRIKLNGPTAQIPGEISRSRALTRGILRSVSVS